MYKNIMLAIDGSDASNAVVTEAIKLAKDKKVRLRLVYVVDEHVVYVGGPSFDYTLLVTALKEEGHNILEDAAKIIENKSSIKVEKSLIELKQFQGRVAEIIVEEATNWPADLLVVGSHGRRGLNRLFLGSVAENIIRIATVPVLVVRGAKD